MSPFDHLTDIEAPQLIYFMSLDNREMVGGSERINDEAVKLAAKAVFAYFRLN